MEILDRILNIFWMAGPFIFPQILLLIVILVLALVNVLRLFETTSPVGSAVGRSVDGILFWGGVTAVIGFMATWSGLLKALRAMQESGLSNVQALYMGLSEAHITTVFGLGVLLLAGFLWFGLRVRIGRRDAVVSG